MADLWRRTLQYLGLVKIAPGPGYSIPNRSFPGRQVCDECGATVPVATQAQHTAWHASQAGVRPERHS